VVCIITFTAETSGISTSYIENEVEVLAKFGDWKARGGTLSSPAVGTLGTYICSLYEYDPVDIS